MFFFPFRTRAFFPHKPRTRFSFSFFFERKEEEEKFAALDFFFFLFFSMTQASVSLGLPPRPPKRELVSHDLDLSGSDYCSSGEDEDSSPANRSSSSRSVGGGSAQPLSGASADCEGPNWKASVQQFDNFLCRVCAQVRERMERVRGERERDSGRGAFSSIGKNLVPFPLCTKARETKLFFSRASALPLPAASQLLCFSPRGGTCVTLHARRR